jgi:hypothetical protein
MDLFVCYYRLQVAIVVDKYQTVRRRPSPAVYELDAHGCARCRGPELAPSLARGLRRPALDPHTLSRSASLKRLRPRSPSCRRSCERCECLWAIVSIRVCRPRRVRTHLEERGRQIAHVHELERRERGQAV